MLKPLGLALALGVAAVAPAEAVPCVTPDVTAAGFGCDAGGLHFSDFAVSASAVLTNATVGIGSVSSPAGLTFQISTTPGVGPGDLLLSYHVTGGLSGVGVANGGIAPVTIGEVVCTTPGLTCPAANRIAELIVGAGETKSAAFASVDFASIVKDINIGVGGFISVLENFHNSTPPPAPVPEPATLFLLGGSAVAVGLWRKRRG